MVQKISSDNFLLIKEGQTNCTAVLGNINWFNVENQIHGRQRVLLKDIRDEDGNLVSEKEWFESKPLINLARKNINETVQFSSYIKQFVIKTGKDPKLLCTFEKIRDINLC